MAWGFTCISVHARQGGLVAGRLCTVGHMITGAQGGGHMRPGWPCSSTRNTRGVLTYRWLCCSTARPCLRASVGHADSSNTRSKVTPRFHLAGNHSHSARSANLARNSTMSHASYAMGPGEGAASYGNANGNGSSGFGPGLSGGLGAGGGGGAGAGGKAGGAPPRSGPSALLSGMFGGGGGVAELGHGSDSFSRWVAGGGLKAMELCIR